MVLSRFLGRARERIEPVLSRSGPTVHSNPDQADDFSYVRRLERMSERMTAELWGHRVAGICFISVIIYLFATEQVRVAFVTFENEDKITYRLYDDLQNKTTRIQLTENYLQEYVKKRETIDNMTEGERYDFIRVFTFKNYWQAFEAQMNPSVNPNSPLAQYKQAGQKREAYVTNVLPVAGDPLAYTVEYTTIDFQGSREISKSAWTVSIRILYVDPKGKKEEVAMNPIGLKVGPYEPRPRTLRDADAAKTAAGALK